MCKFDYPLSLAP